MVSENFIICYTGLCTRLPLSQLDWRSWTVDTLQFFIPERGKHCITDVCCNVVSLAPTFSLYLKQKKKISIPSMIIKGCKISLTSGRTFSENLDNQLFCPILSIYWDAWSARYFSASTRHSVSEGNKIVGISCLATSLYKVCIIYFLITSKD